MLKIPKLPVLAVDFDGVVNSYSNGWGDGTIDTAPVDGCAAALHALSKRYQMVIFTARHDLSAVRAWLVEYHLNQYFHDITNRKPAAVAYLDDRAIRFTNWAQALEELL